MGDIPGAQFEIRAPDTLREIKDIGNGAIKI